MGFAFVIIMMMLMLIHVSGFAQACGSPDTLLSYFKLPEEDDLCFLLTYVPPFFIQHGIELKEFIRSRTFATIKKTFGDHRAVDAIYVYAMKLTHNNTAVALFLSMTSSFDHRMLGLKLPFMHFELPLSNETEQEFQTRLTNLPSALYSDTPPSKQGDRDKIQHFFGSAFLTYVFESGEIADRIGEFIEKGENTFVVEGAFDARDERANREGQAFGTALLQDRACLPSEFIKLPVALVEQIVLVTQCSGVW